MVVVGDSGTPIPVETGMLPGLMTAVPSANEAFNIVEPPAVIDVGKAKKLVIDAGGSTRTVVVRVVAVPASFVTVTV